MEKKVFCPKCGKQSHENDSYCMSCGFPFHERKKTSKNNWVLIIILLIIAAILGLRLVFKILSS